MFVFNIKLNKGLFTKLLIGTLVIVILLVFIVVYFKFRNAVSTVRVNDELPTSCLEINSSNYTSILKDSHENIDKYVGKNVKFVGFIYRLYDFTENQFVLAREMIISSDNHAVVVGFLCDSCKVNGFNSNSFSDGDWIEAEGVIRKGYYHGDLPVIELKSVTKTSVPNNQYVYPPDSGYVSNSI